MELLHVEFGLFAAAGPNDRAAFVVDFEHVLLRFVFGKSEDFSKDQSDVAHEVDRVVVNDDMPRDVQAGLLARFCFRRVNGRHSYESGGSQQVCAGRDLLQAFLHACPELSDRRGPHFQEDKSGDGHLWRDVKNCRPGGENGGEVAGGLPGFHRFAVALERARGGRWTKIHRDKPSGGAAVPGGGSGETGIEPGIDF